MLSGNDTEFISKWLKEELGIIYQHCGTARSKQITYDLPFVKKKNLILRFDFNCARVIIWTY